MGNEELEIQHHDDVSDNEDNEQFSEVNHDKDKEQKENKSEKKVSFEQDNLGKMISFYKKKSYEAGYNNALKEFKDQINFRGNDMNELDQETLNKLIEKQTEEKVKQHLKSIADAHEHQLAASHADRFKNKIAEASSKYGDDFNKNFDDDIFNSIKLNADYIVPKLNSVSNSEDVIREFTMFPEKLANIINLSKSGMHNRAMKEIENISKSYLESGKMIDKIPHDQEPINEIKPSHITGDKKSISGYEFGRKLKF